MGLEKMLYGVEKTLSSPSGREALTGVATVAAPAAVAAAPFVATVAVGGAIAFGVGYGAAWLADKLTDS